MTDDRAAFARKVSASLVWVAVGTIVSKLLRLVALFMVLDVITKADLGLAQTAITFFGILQSLTELGLGAAIIQYRRKDGTAAGDPTRAELNALFWLSLYVSAALYAVLFVTAGLVASFYDAPAMGPLIQVQSLGVLVFALYLVPKSLLTRELAFGKIAVAENVAGVLSAVAMIVLAHAGLGVWAIIAGEVGARAFELVFFQIFRPWLPSAVTTDFAPVREQVKFGLYATGSRFLYRLYTDADYLVIGKLLGQEATGLYAFAFRVVFDIQKALVSIVSQVAFPAFAHLQHDKPELARYLFAISRGMTLFVGVALAFLFACPEDLLALLGYEQWLAAVPLIRIFCVVALARTVIPLVPQVLNALGEARLNFLYSLTLSVVMPVSFIIGAQVGTDGVAWSWLVAYPPLSIIMVVYGARLLEIPFGSFARQVFAGTPLVLALGAGAYALVLGLAAMGLGPAPRAAIALVATLGGGALWVWKREPVFVERVFRRKKKKVSAT